MTHVGRQRQHNEDSYLVENEAHLFLVADGMGGHAAGEIASRIAVDSISEFILHTKEDDGTWPHAYDEAYKRTTNRLSVSNVANSCRFPSTESKSSHTSENARLSGSDRSQRLVSSMSLCSAGANGSFL